ncbi:hypothetical protein OUZ56_031311 [Daphnia magna]|uniref:Uncharacterized protein n=1 Tax=Daphnia magna TaxID=35525 RepID=A0ABQ9ZTV9_9CRUS|nr:hypothetical protein OUZ56_031311 [Daphnia magna]
MGEEKRKKKKDGPFLYRPSKYKKKTCKRISYDVDTHTQKRCGQQFMHRIGRIWRNENIFWRLCCSRSQRVSHLPASSCRRRKQVKLCRFLLLSRLSITQTERKKKNETKEEKKQETKREATCETNNSVSKLIAGTQPPRWWSAGSR